MMMAPASNRPDEMTLHDVLRGMEVTSVRGSAAIAVRSVTDDSRSVESGDLFVAVRGLSVDGHDYLAAAEEAGAVAAVVEREMPFGGTLVVVPRASVALGIAAANRAGNPGDRMQLVGLTGTNGKTTTTYILESIFAAAGRQPGVVGTVTYRFAGQSRAAPFTTPTAPALQALLREMADAGTSDAILEVSSHALELDRVSGLRFRAGAFTNFTQDHLDLHGSMEAYRAAKQRLFGEYLDPEGVAVIWADDPAAESMVADYHGRVVRVTAGPLERVEPPAARVELQASTLQGIRARLALAAGARWAGGELIEPATFEIASPLVGDHNASNLALGAVIAAELGIDPAAIASGIETLTRVPGRLDMVDPHAEIPILVDYAHTPDALRNSLAALRPLCAGRLICVFGCGGDRDQAKRPLMGRAVAEGATLAVVTSDNPRSEPPKAIIEQILPGMTAMSRIQLDDLVAAQAGYAVQENRREAIRAAVLAAQPKDVVLIAGKGHEPYQILGPTTIHFDDREEGQDALALREERTR